MSDRTREGLDSGTGSGAGVGRRRRNQLPPGFHVDAEGYLHDSDGYVVDDEGFAVTIADLQSGRYPMLDSTFGPGEGAHDPEAVLDDYRATGADGHSDIGRPDEEFDDAWQTGAGYTGGGRDNRRYGDVRYGADDDELGDPEFHGQSARMADFDEPDADHFEGYAGDDDGLGDEGFGDYDDYDDYESITPYRRGRRKILGALVGVFVFLMLCCVGFVWWVTRQIDPPGEMGAAIPSVIIPKGSGREQTGRILEAKGVISSASVWNWYLKVAGAPPWLAGDYGGFHKGSSITEALDALEKGPKKEATKRVTITEGSTLFRAVNQIAAKYPNYKADQFWEALDSGQVKSKYVDQTRFQIPPGWVVPPGTRFSPWEGMLFPDTYELPEKGTPAEILQVLATNMDETLDELGYDGAISRTGRTPYELIIMASMIERETGSPDEERAQIARVILNRLDRGEPLGVDATTRYSHANPDGGLTSSDLNDTTDPWNTRRRKGLPITPIGLPSRKSLEGAITPAEGDWLYYVLTAPGVHTFTADYDEFVNLKKKAQKDGLF